MSYEREILRELKTLNTAVKKLNETNEQIMNILLTQPSRAEHLLSLGASIVGVLGIVDVIQQIIAWAGG
jgi:hypothetical protein